MEVQQRQQLGELLRPRQADTRRRMNAARNAIYRDSTAPGAGFALKLLLVHSRDDLRKSNFVVAVHKGVGLAASESM